MQKIVHNKLVRDKILEVINANGGEYESSVLSNDDFTHKLKKKLLEEAMEVQEAMDNTTLTAELADVLEVLETIAADKNISMDEVRAAQKKKLHTNGGFEKKLYLHWSTKK